MMLTNDKIYVLDLLLSAKIKQYEIVINIVKRILHKGNIY